ncbi:hypothetical protein XENOCAPTIV_003986 [Xenoophorus captivus]|uniref:Uncharacterized protein n=1 Tax=Xenoophorus captivus TaxID=1517983 RepID=A0ABV0SFW5_9TELE
MQTPWGGGAGLGRHAIVLFCYHPGACVGSAGTEVVEMALGSLTSWKDWWGDCPSLVGCCLCECSGHVRVLGSCQVAYGSRDVSGSETQGLRRALVGILPF